MITYILCEVITIFQKFKTFWNVFFESIKEAYNKAFKKPIEAEEQEWRDTTKINFLDIFVKKLSNLATLEATFEIESDSTQTERLKVLCQSLEDKRSDITKGMLADGDYYVFPAHNRKGEIVHSYLTQQQVRILDADGEDITEVNAIIDWLVDTNNKVFFLLRHHKLEDNGTLTIDYLAVNDSGKPANVPKWEHINGKAFSFANANHIGMGRYKSPQSSRGLSPVYGVPLNFGCADIEDKIFNDLKLIEYEFKNAKSKIFADPRILMTDEEKKEYTIPENMYPLEKKGGVTGSVIDIFNPDIRSSEHYAKLVADMELYEKEVGVNKGFLTEPTPTANATATEIKRSNNDTVSMLGDIHTAIDAGNKMTLLADSVFLNISPDLWSYSSDWYDPFEDPDAQWKRLLEAKNNGAAEEEDLVRWQFPNLSDKEVAEKLERIKAAKQADSEAAFNRAFAGEE